MLVCVHVCGSVRKPGMTHPENPQTVSSALSTVSVGAHDSSVLMVWVLKKIVLVANKDYRVSNAKLRRKTVGRPQLLYVANHMISTTVDKVGA